MACAERPWVLVCGGFHEVGGMDRLNAALARHLAARGTPVQLVGHDIDASFDSERAVSMTRVPRPGGIYLAGEVSLARAADRARAALAARGPVPVVLGNGGNCLSADVNWVHSVHHAWPCADTGAPVWFRAKNRAFKAWSRRREVTAFRTARAIVANSQRTRRELAALVHLDPALIDVVYPGTDPSWVPPSPAAREAARVAWCRDPRVPLVALIGAVGHDVNKGLDTLLAAWTGLHGSAGWSAELVVAGPGDTARWRADAAQCPSIRFTGPIANAGELLDAADLIVSPVRYEAYGLAVHEAICRGVPPLVSRTAGIVERFPSGFDDMLLDSPGVAGELAARLLEWRRDVPAWRRRADALRQTFRGATLETMCSAIARVGDRLERSHAAGTVA